MYSTFSKLPEERKQGMLQLVRRWKDTGSATTILEEGLRVLSSDKRERAYDIVERHVREIAAIACVYGKGSKPKLALSKEDARMLLELVHDINGTDTDQSTKSQMVEIAAKVLFSGERPSTLSDARWKPLLALLGEMEPKVLQGSLF